MSIDERRRCLIETIKEKELELQELNATYGEQFQVRPRHSSSGFSAEQLHEIAQLLQTFQKSGCPATERAHEQRLIDIAPRFNLNEPSISWEAFEIFFDVNRVISDQLKFNILNGRLKSETMQQFGKENPGCGGDLKKLKQFLMAYAKEFSPCMNHHKSLEKYSQGALLRDIFHEAKLMADLEREERIKLNAFFLSSGSNKKVIENHLHLSLDKFVYKVRQKWNSEPRPTALPRSPFSKFRSYTPPSPYREHQNAPRTTPPHTEPVSPSPTLNAKPFASPARTYREFKNKSLSPLKPVVRNEEALCFYHKRFGRQSFKCEGGDCRMAEAPSSRNEQQHVRWSDERTQQGNVVKNLTQGN